MVNKAIHKVQQTHKLMNQNMTIILFANEWNNNHSAYSSSNKHAKNQSKRKSLSLRGLNCIIGLHTLAVLLTVSKLQGMPKTKFLA